MNKLFASIVVSFIFLTNGHAETAEPVPQPVTIPGSATHFLKSQKIDQTFKINVALPNSYGEGGRRFPVVYLTDGGGNIFSVVVGNLRLLSLVAEIPEVIVVGVGYDTHDLVRGLSLRERDLTPTNNEAYTEKARQNPIFPLAPDITPGGAGDFVQFINHELKPFINNTYRTEADNETLVGYSLGGLFGLYVLFNHSNSFDKYVIGSPSIWWDDLVSFRYESEYAKNNKDLGKHVFLSAGSLEEEPGDEYQAITNMVNMFLRLNERHYPGLALDHQIFAGETHLSGIGVSLNRGLRFVFKDEIPSPAQAK